MERRGIRVRCESEFEERGALCRLYFSAGGHSRLRVESCGTLVPDQASVLGVSVLGGALVLAGALCSKVYSELCMTLGHEVGPAPARAWRALHTVSNPYVYILRAVISIVIAFFLLHYRRFFYTRCREYHSAFEYMTFSFFICGRRFFTSSRLINI
jgi:hypothetical protein